MHQVVGLIAVLLQLGTLSYLYILSRRMDTVLNRLDADIRSDTLKSTLSDVKKSLQPTVDTVQQLARAMKVVTPMYNDWKAGKLTNPVMGCKVRQQPLEDRLDSDRVT